VGDPCFCWLAIFVSFVTRYAREKERGNEHHEVKISKDPPAQEIFRYHKRGKLVKKSPIKVTM
jgi:hypothetical protein